MFFRKRKPKIKYVMVYKKVIDLENRYMVVNYRTHKREIYQEGENKNGKFKNKKK